MQSDPHDEPQSLDSSAGGDALRADTGDGVSPPEGSTQPAPPEGESATDASEKAAGAVPPPPMMPAPRSVPRGRSASPAPPRMPVPGTPGPWVNPPPSSGQPGATGGSEPDDRPETGDHPLASAAVLAEGPSDGPRATASSLPEMAPAAPPDQVDGLVGVCPYLRSVDGERGSSQPDPDHRCAAQDPPGSLPLAFQERFCLTDRYPRCEMFKYAQEVAGSGAIPAAALPGATAAPARRSVSLALGSAGDNSHRSLLIAAGGIGGIVLLIVLLVLGMGSCSGGDAPAGPESGTPMPGASVDATDDGAGEPQPTATPVPEPTVTPGVDATDGPSGAQQIVLYEVQEGEGLLRIAETFGVTRRAILKANEGMEESKPYVETGQIINVPVSDALSVEQLEDIVGYMGPAG